MGAAGREGGSRVGNVAWVWLLWGELPGGVVAC